MYMVNPFGTVLFFTIETWLKLNIFFDGIYLKLLNACRFRLVIILLNARDRNKSKYHSIVFLSIYQYKLIKCFTTFWT